MRRLHRLAAAAAMLLPASPGAWAEPAARAPALTAATAPGATPARAQNVCERELARAARTYDIPLQILYAVGLTESGGDGALQPFMLYFEGRDHLPATLPDALKMFHAAHDRGIELIDIGCMQVNYYWHKAEFHTLEEMFDPRLNVEQAARFLKELKKRHGSWTMAVARYNAGPNNTAGQQRYVCRVMKNLVAAGVGQWTAQSHAFCEAPPVAAQTPAAPSVAPQSAPAPAPAGIF